ncbi:glycosyltransferase [Candidatus Micrarchaeota archaeon]|nr:glycosyltransferase [Candidatus Micrarchaeota archaeon]
MLSVVIPAHLEEKRLAGPLKKLVELLASRKISFEVVLVTDEQDQTASVARRVFPRVRLLVARHSEGKGAALNRGFAVAKGDVWSFYDADGATAPEAFLDALAALRHADVVIGSRYVGAARVRRPWYRDWSRRVYHFLVQWLFGLRFADTQCGFKVFKAAAARSVLSRMQSKGFEWDVEFLWRCKKRGLTVLELPVAWHSVPGGPVEAAKIRSAVTLLAHTVALRFSR